jgi:hypothetical protein
VKIASKDADAVDFWRITGLQSERFVFSTHRFWLAFSSPVFCRHEMVRYADLKFKQEMPKEFPDLLISGLLS